DGDLNFIIANMTGKELLECAQKCSKRNEVAFAGVKMTVKMLDDDSIWYKSLLFEGEELDLNKTYRVVTLKGVAYNTKITDEYVDYKFYDIFKNYIINCLNKVVDTPKDLIFEN
ncbi:MAG: hypothetical protein ACI388_00005, partial [Methanobrevibacter sp.]|uniref:hypothetical protein n=1 Tax=Methanobrevibacter sp. TaxID=66852 RepID=UPI003F00A8DD